MNSCQAFRKSNVRKTLVIIFKGKTLRICFVSLEFPPFQVGGSGIYAEKITNALSKLGHDVTVITPMFMQKKAIENIGKLKVIRVPIVSLPSLRFFSFEISRFLGCRRDNFDIVHLNDGCHLINGNSHQPIVVTVHHSPRVLRARSLADGCLKDFITGELNPLNAYMEKKTLKKSNKIISVSEDTKVSIISQYGLDSEKIAIVPNGFDLNNFIFSKAETTEIRQSFGIMDGEKLIVSTAGRIDDPRKGIKYLLLALVKVLKRHKNVKCVITGSGDLRSLSAYLDDLPVGKVKFVGYTSDNVKRKLVAACDLFVLPSLHEGFSLSILEAMGARKPVISTNSGAIPELIVQKKNGVLVEPRNYLQLSEAIDTLLFDEKQAQELGQCSYQRSKAYSWERTAKLTEQVYTDTLRC